MRAPKKEFSPIVKELRFSSTRLKPVVKKLQLSSTSNNLKELSATNPEMVYNSSAQQQQAASNQPGKAHIADILRV